MTGTRMLQMINGFKIFLETAEKEKLEALVEDDRNIFIIFCRIRMCSVFQKNG